MSPSSKFTIKGFFIKLIAVFIALYLLIWVISSPVIKHFSAAPLAELGLTLSDDSSIRFNPFLMKLTIKNLTLLKNQTKVAAIKRLDAQLALHKLIVDKIELQEFAIDEFFISLAQKNDVLLVAGMTLPVTQGDEHKQQVESAKDEPAINFPYQIILPKLSITNSSIAIDIDENAHTVILNELLITDVLATTQQQHAKVALSALIDQATLNLHADATLDQGNGEINSEVALKAYPLAKLQHFIKPLQKLSGQFSLNSKQQLTITPKTLNIVLNNAEINNTALVASDKFYTFNLKALNYQANDFVITLENNVMTALQGKAQLNLSNAHLLGENNQQELLSFEQFLLQDIELKLPETSESEQEALPQPQVNIAMLTLDKLLASKKHDIDLPPLATLGKISISNIAANANSLAIGKVTLDSLTSDIILNKDNLIANLVAFAAVDDSSITEESTINNDDENTPSLETTSTKNIDTNSQTDKSNTTSGNDFKISLKAFNMINNNQISFVDNSVTPKYTRIVFLDNIHLGALSNHHDSQENETPIVLKGRSNQYAKFDFSGFIKPFAQAQTYHLKGGLSELSLPAVSTYMKDALQLELKSGQLNTDVDITLVDDNIDGDVSFIIKGLETTAANNDEVNVVKDQASLPLNAALGMLMDGDGNLELAVPLSGKTSDPSFGLSSFIALVTKKAAMSAVESYLMKTFVPYANIVSVAKTAGEFLLKVRFEDLAYQVKQITPNAKQQAYLDQFIALMQDKTDTQVKLCAISVPQDISLSSGSEVVDKEQIQQLKNLGEQREQALKAYLIKHGKIDSARLLLCTPQIDSSKDAQPKMVISV